MYRGKWTWLRVSNAVIPVFFWIQSHGFVYSYMLFVGEGARSTRLQLFFQCDGFVGSIADRFQFWKTRVNHKHTVRVETISNQSLYIIIHYLQLICICQTCFTSILYPQSHVHKTMINVETSFFSRCLRGKDVDVRQLFAGQFQPRWDLHVGHPQTWGRLTISISPSAKKTGELWNGNLRHNRHNYDN